MSPIVSVIVPTKNRPLELAAALGSVAAQTLANLEVVVVNDGGVDVRPVVERFARSLDIRLIDHPVCAGPSAARNTGLDAATGRFIGYLDDDDEYLPGNLQAAVEAAIRQDADLVYCDAQIRTRRGDPSRAANRWTYDLPFEPGFLEVMNFIPPVTVLYRRCEVRFDLDLPVAEDWDMWLRLARGHGYRFAHLPQVGAIYHRVKDNGSITASADDNLEDFAVFYDSYRAICERWPVPEDSREHLYRRFMIQMHDMVCSHLAAGDSLTHLYYERILRILYAGFTGTLPDEEMPERMEQALVGPPEHAATPDASGRATAQIGDPAR
jgi:glycosyltransferase involved in cell wall biosynthesis